MIEARQGMIVSDATVSPSTVADSFVAQLVQLNSGAETVAGAEVTLDICTACARCRVEALLQKIDRRSGKVLEEAPAALKAGEVGFCRLSPLQPVRRPEFAACIPGGVGRPRCGSAVPRTVSGCRGPLLLCRATAAASGHGQIHFVGPLLLLLSFSPAHSWTLAQCKVLGLQRNGCGRAMFIMGGACLLERALRFKGVEVVDHHRQVRNPACGGVCGAVGRRVLARLWQAVTAYGFIGDWGSLVQPLCSGSHSVPCGVLCPLSQCSLPHEYLAGADRAWGRALPQVCAAQALVHDGMALSCRVAMRRVCVSMRLCSSTLSW